MKNSYRISLAAFSLAALVGVTACGADNASVPPQGNSTEQSVSPATGPKDANFRSPFTHEGTVFPAGWDNSDGWWKTVADTDQPIVAAGDYTAYVDVSEVVVGAAKSGTLVVVDGKGHQVYTSKENSGFSEVRGNELHRVSKNGKDYLVFIETGDLAGSETSAKKDKTYSSSVTVIDENGKEVYSKVLGANERADVGEDETTTASNVSSDDSIRVTTRDSAGKTVGIPQVLDVVTGEMSAAPSLSGAEWVGRYDGVDIFRTAEGVTNGKWTVATTGTIEKVGDLVQAVQNNKDKSGYATDDTCNVFDPHTGTLNPALGLAKDECIDVRNTSPDGNYVVNSNTSVIDIAGGKVYKVGSDIDFDIESVTNDGVIYGDSGQDNAAHLNMNSDDEPTVEPGTTIAPWFVSDSGLAAFHDSKDGFYFLVKK